MTAPGYGQALLCLVLGTLMHEADLIVAGGQNLTIILIKISGFPVRARCCYVLCSALLHVKLTWPD